MTWEVWLSPKVFGDGKRRHLQGAAIRKCRR
jgi:hypothetical protein